MLKKYFILNMLIFIFPHIYCMQRAKEAIGSIQSQLQEGKTLLSVYITKEDVDAFEKGEYERLKQKSELQDMLDEYENFFRKKAATPAGRKELEDYVYNLNNELNASQIDVVQRSKEKQRYITVYKKPKEAIWALLQLDAARKILDLSDKADWREWLQKRDVAQAKSQIQRIKEEVINWKNENRPRYDGMIQKSKGERAKLESLKKFAPPGDAQQLDQLIRAYLNFENIIKPNSDYLLAKEDFELANRMRDFDEKYFVIRNPIAEQVIGRKIPSWTTAEKILASENQKKENALAEIKRLSKELDPLVKYLEEKQERQ